MEGFDVVVILEDGHSIKIPADIVPLITLVHKTVSLAPEGLKAPVPLPKIRGQTFSKVLEWAELHKDDPTLLAKALESNPTNGNLPNSAAPLKLKLSGLSTSIDDQDAEADDLEEDDSAESGVEGFNEISLDKDILIFPADRKLIESLDIPNLIDLTAAANYLAMESLLDLCCKAIANHMTGLSVEELRLKFNIPNDFTAEEEAKLRSQFGWADE